MIDVRGLVMPYMGSDTTARRRDGQPTYDPYDGPQRESNTSTKANKLRVSIEVLILNLQPVRRSQKKPYEHKLKKA